MAKTTPVLLLFALLAASGCRDEAAPAPDAARRPEVVIEIPPPEPPPPVFDVIHVEETNAPRDGVQQRAVRIVVPAPQNRSEVEEAAKAVYRAFVEDIETTQSDAPQKHVNILVYDNEPDAEQADGYHILHAGTDGAAAELPPWEELPQTWQWADPDFRPTDHMLAIFREYRTGLSAADDVEDASGDPSGVDSLSRQLMSKYGLTEGELLLVISYVMLWRRGEPLTSDAIAEQADLIGQEWRGDGTE